MKEGYAKTYSFALQGLSASKIEIEVEVRPGLRQFQIVGLPDKAVEEAKERVASALKSCGFESPRQGGWRVLVNLAPADLKKEGSHFDLPIALAFLKATSQIDFPVENLVSWGELGLQGEVRGVRGSFILCQEAKSFFPFLLLPQENELEARLSGIPFIGAASLREAIQKLSLEDVQKGRAQLSFKSDPLAYPWWVKGQSLAKKALVLAAAGSHHLLLIGPPGTGKTLLAKSLLWLFPPLSSEELQEVAKIYSWEGKLESSISRPFRAPHHSSSKSALIGGGNPPRLGEITLAHKGVLFLDELAEFRRDVLEALRQPLEEKKVVISRARYRWELASDFTLVAASNPCPCGFWGDKTRSCSCTFAQRQSYQRKLRGPLLDRIDIVVWVERLSQEDVLEKEEDTKEVLYWEKEKEKILRARGVQQERQGKPNSALTPPEIATFCQIPRPLEKYLAELIEKGEITMRGYHKILKIARTLADLEERETIQEKDVMIGLQFREGSVFL